MNLTLKKECYSYILTILIILIIALMIKISFSNFIEKFTYSFTIKFKDEINFSPTVLQELKFIFSTSQSFPSAAELERQGPVSAQPSQDGNSNIVTFNNTTKPTSPYSVFINHTNPAIRAQLKSLFYNTNLQDGSAPGTQVEDMGENGIRLDLSNNSDDDLTVILKDTA